MAAVDNTRPSLRFLSPQPLIQAHACVSAPSVNRTVMSRVEQPGLFTSRIAYDRSPFPTVAVALIDTTGYGTVTVGSIEH